MGGAVFSLLAPFLQHPLLLAPHTFKKKEFSPSGFLSKENFKKV
jgi:hypothetical protein